MTLARSEVVTQEEGIYHCTARCVRRAYLCGFDSYSQRSFDHRKQWVRNRLKFLVDVFCIDVLAYALMSNHQHTLLRTRPDLLAKLTDEEVAARWMRLYSSIDPDSSNYGSAVETLAQNKPRIALLRERLGSISWFMKSLSEFIARRANKEDDCKGRFWEGRFKCQRICDEAALLTCSIYIDLNPIRAEIAQTPETSEYTSAWERIRSIKRDKRPKNEPPLWLSPIQSGRGKKGYLPMSLPEYLMILDATGREVRVGKRGRIPVELEPILMRLGIEREHWVETTRKYGKSFSSFAGSRSSLEQVAASLQRTWVKGSRLAGRVFF